MTHLNPLLYFIKIKYITNTVEHSMTLPCNPQSGWVVGSEPSITPKAGADILMSVAVDALVAILRPALATVTDIVSAEAWFAPSPTSDPVWVYTHPIGLAGTGAATATNMLQFVISFRTFLGGVYRMFLMEPSSSITANVRASYPFGAGTATNISNYLTGSTGWVIGRDGGSLVVPIWQTSKYNDALRKKRLFI